MKVSHTIVAGILMGLALGAGITLASFPSVSDRLAPPAATLASATPIDGKVPRALVDRTVHNFGRVARDSRVRHAFKVSNIGTAPLTLKSGGTTCTKCTIAELARNELQPGESTEVTVEYLPTVAQPNFRQTATLLTNDPDQPRIELNIFGQVASPYTVTPESLVLSRFSATEPVKSDIKIQVFVSDKVELVSHQLASAQSASHFDVQSRPMAADQLTEEGAKCGLLVTVTIKPGLPLGPVRQTIRLELALAGVEQHPQIEIPVEGTVDADISIAGPGWDPDRGLLTLGAVKSTAGASRDLFLLVRGEHRQNLSVKPAKVVPEWLQVSLGEPSELKGGAVVKIPLRITIPPNSPVVNHSGTSVGKFAEVELETSHPDVPKIRMLIKFAIEQ